MLSNKEINRICGGNYSDELIDKLRKWYSHQSTQQVITNLDTKSLRHLLPVSFVKKYIDIKNKEVLEVGCGTGQNMVCYAAAGAKHVFGIDIDPFSVDIATLRCKEENIPYSTKLGNFLEEDFGNKKYHVINCIGVLEHVGKENQERLILKMFSLLHSGGILYIQVPNKSCIIDSHDSKLPFAHWLPRPVAKKYARLFHRVTPQWDPMHYLFTKKIINNQKSAEILNKIDVCENVKEFLTYRTRDRKSMRNYIFAFVVILAYPFFQNNINIILPNINLIIRKH